MTEQIGLEAVLEDTNWRKGVGNYIDNVRQMDLKTAGLSRSLNAGFMSMGRSVLSFGATAVKAVGIAAVGATAALGAGIVKLTMDAADLPGIEAAFDGIATASGKSAAEVLAALQAQSFGMVENRDLMESYNKAAMLVSDTFANQLPDAMGFLGKVSAATGQDMGFMLDSLVTGVGRLSPMILDNLGIQVDLTQAYDDYAASIGVAAGELTKEQQQAALMNQVLMKLEENTAAMPDITESMSTKMAAFKTTLKNTGAEIGKAFLPAMGTLLDTIGNLVHNIGPQVTTWAQAAGIWLSEFLPMAIQTLANFWTTVLLPSMQIAWSYVQSTIIPLLQTVWEWLSTNLPIAIAFVTEHWDEFKGALIAIGAVLAASGIVAAIAGIVAALNPVTLAIGAIVAAAALLGAAWAGNWGGIRDTLTEVWTTTLQPALEELQIWLAENLPIAIEALKEFWVSTLQPALEQVWGFIVQTLIPAFGQVVAWLAENIPVAIQAASDFWQNTLKPALETVWTFITESLIPTIENIVDWLATNIPEAIDTASDYWENTLKPALETVWDFINDYIIPIFEGIITIFNETLRIALEGMALLWEETLKPALETVWEYIDENLMPIFEEITDFLSGVASDTISTFITDSIAKLSEGLKTLVAWLTKVKGWIDKIAAALADFSWGDLGDGAMPESPPKLAVGFAMVTEQAQKFREVLRGISALPVSPIIKGIMGGPLDDMLGAGKTLGGIGGRLVGFRSKQTQRELDKLKSELEEFDKTFLGGATAESLTEPLQQRRLDIVTSIAEKEKEIAEHQRQAMELQKQQEKLGFLQDQMKLLEFIREQGLNPAEVLGDIKLGMDASVPDIVAAMNKAMEQILSAANQELSGDNLSSPLNTSTNMIQNATDNRIFNMNNNIQMAGGMSYEAFRAMLIEIIRAEFGGTL